MEEELATKLCKHCKSVISRDAKICPYCRKRQRPNGCLVVILVILVWARLISFVDDISLRVEEHFRQPAVSAAAAPEPSRAPLATPTPKPTLKATATPEPAPEAAATPEPVPEVTAAPEPVQREQSLQGIRPEFKEAMDSYVEFFREYAAFMEMFEEDPDDSTLLYSYLVYLSQFAETMEKLEAMDEGEMTREEAAYYLKALAVIEGYLLNAAA